MDMFECLSSCDLISHPCGRGRGRTTVYDHLANVCSCKQRK